MNLNEAVSARAALVLVALCVGGRVLARAIEDEVLGDELRKSAERHILTTTGWQDAARAGEAV